MLISPIFFIFSAPVRGGCAGLWLPIRFSCTVARPAHTGVLLPGLECALSFLCDARLRDHALNLLRVGSRCAASPPPPSASPHSSVGKSQLLLQHPPHHPLLPSNSPPDPQNLAQNSRLATSRPPIANRPRCAPFLPPPHPPPLIILRTSFDNCSSIGRLAPFSPPTLHPTPQIAPNLPSLATSRPLTNLVFASYRNVADSTAPGTVVHASLTL